jgi:hypothetical protein
MNTRVSGLYTGLLLALGPALAAAGISTTPSNPGFGAPTYSQAELDAARATARATGRLEAASECIADPKHCGCADNINPCGVQLSSVLTSAKFGETEPNNHIVSADPLVNGVKYWGQIGRAHV